MIIKLDRIRIKRPNKELLIDYEASTFASHLTYKWDHQRGDWLPRLRRSAQSAETPQNALQHRLEEKICCLCWESLKGSLVIDI